MRTTDNEPDPMVARRRQGHCHRLTCPHCPKYGEPIRRIVNGAGVRFRITLDAGETPTGRRQESKLLDTLAEDRAYVVARTAELAKAKAEGRVVDRTKMTVNELADLWLDAKRGHVREVTREGYAHSLKPVRRRLGGRRVQSLTFNDIAELSRWLVREGGKRGQGLGWHAARASLMSFKAILDYAVRVEQMVSVNVAKGVTVPKSQEPDATLERWTADEMMTFVETADNDPQAATWRLLCLGLRREEVLGLTWDAVDFEAGTVAIRQTRVKVSATTDPKGWIVGNPKSRASRRVVRPDDVLPGTMGALKRLRLASPPTPHGLIFIDPAGEPLRPDALSRQFKALAQAAKVPRIRVHSTRHTCAYLLQDAGVPAVRAAAWRGHELAVHVSVYLFAREDDVEVAGAALGRVLARAAAGS